MVHMRPRDGANFRHSMIQGLEKCPGSCCFTSFILSTTSFVAGWPCAFPRLPWSYTAGFRVKFPLPKLICQILVKTHWLALFGSRKMELSGWQGLDSTLNDIWWFQNTVYIMGIIPTLMAVRRSSILFLSLLGTGCPQKGGFLWMSFQFSN